MKLERRFFIWFELLCILAVVGLTLNYNDCATGIYIAVFSLTALYAHKEQKKLKKEEEEDIRIQSEIDRWIDSQQDEGR